VRVGPAPANLPLVPYTFVSDTKVIIGEGKTPAQAYGEKEKIV
jgi:Rieske Fe-S protein